MQPERERVRAHFRDVVAELRAKPSTHVVRTALIDVLATYGERGAFPTNRDFVDRRMPYFVDATGVRCAVAHLMHMTGDDDLVSDIARDHNNALVPELAGDPRLHTWLAKAGFDAVEAARIQPTYCFWEISCICASMTEPAFMRVEIVTPSDEQSEARVIAAYGDTAAVPGDLIDVYIAKAPVDSQFVVVPLGEGPARMIGAVRDGLMLAIGCDDWLPVDDVISAWGLTATSGGRNRTECVDYLADAHPEIERPCAEMNEPQPEDEGCAGGEPSWLGLSALGWALRRRLTRSV